MLFDFILVKLFMPVRHDGVIFGMHTYQRPEQVARRLIMCLDFIQRLIMCLDFIRGGSFIWVTLNSEVEGIIIIRS